VIWLSHGARIAIAREACRWRVRETGGPLFGYDADDGSVVVESARGPGPGAVHGRFHYKPDREAVAAAIDQELAGSDGARYLVGEWHSHPLGRAVASARDRRSVQGMSEDVAVGLQRPIALIQATRPWGRRVRAAEITAWCWDPARSEVIRAATSGFSLLR
jgi:integrative and conjugative element protein (TIGR02256 family)